MHSKKFIYLSLMAFIAITFIWGASQAPSQIPDNQSHLDEFNVSCQTTWDGNSWESCQTNAVTAQSSFIATFCVTAPSCNYNCIDEHIHYPPSRDAYLKATNLAPGQSLSHLICPGGEPCPQCCLTYHWTTTQGVGYYIYAYNTTTSYSCGPTKASFKGRDFNCVYD